jgi:hypothetical protein
MDRDPYDAYIDNEQEDDMDFEVKGLARDRKIAQRSKTMRVTGRSIFTIQQSQKKRDNKTKGNVNG